MNKSSIEITKLAQVATVTLNAPEKHNAFDDATIRELEQAFIGVESDDDIRVMVLAANGKSFSAGADLRWMKRMASYSKEENLNDARKLASMLKTLNNLAIPTIARVQGAAFGGAVGLIACCDMAVASKRASFSLSEVKIGLIPATISPYVIAAMGSRSARRFFMTGERFTAEKAAQLGLISELCDEAELDTHVNGLTNQLLANSPDAVSAAKRLVFDLNNKVIDDAVIEDTSQRIASIRVSNEGQEGLNAFIEKRSPLWKPAKP